MESFKVTHANVDMKLSCFTYVTQHNVLQVHVVCHKSQNLFLKAEQRCAVTPIVHCFLARIHRWTLGLILHSALANRLKWMWERASLWQADFSSPEQMSQMQDHTGILILVSWGTWIIFFKSAELMALLTATQDTNAGIQWKSRELNSVLHTSALIVHGCCLPKINLPQVLGTLWTFLQKFQIDSLNSVP